ncbi:TIGR03032 family protein [uncultured Pelagimonas sp.]|uniref:TIGR03032 family protein n=1 Tax=uncultured Pelagimonas sp. TaxID=1618102 RepID=UPI0026220861|nr:TIGR03032 family protein [uncultured Pelagimonas sp.]
MEFHFSRLFPAWLKSQRLSLAVSAYQVGKLLLIGSTEDGRVSIFDRSFPRCMGISLTQNGFFVSTLAHLWEFSDFGADHAVTGGYDTAYVPLKTHLVGDVDIHDVCTTSDNSPLFVVTRYNCIAGLSDTRNFEVKWTPPFIDKIAAEDRCHLNGLAIDEEGARLVTGLKMSNVSDGWRRKRSGNGFLMDVQSNKILLSDLHMPHSPRLHDGKAYFLESGRGTLCSMDLETQKVQNICAFPGFPRGLAFHGRYAIVGVSRERSGSGGFGDLPLQAKLQDDGIEQACGIFVINLLTGDIEHSIEFSQGVDELFDVCPLPGVRQPMAYGTNLDDLRLIVKPTIGSQYSTK